MFFLHKLQKGGNLLNHIFDFKETVYDLAIFKIKYDEEDLSLVFLCSLPWTYSNLRDTILYRNNSRILHEVYGVLIILK